MDETIYEYDYGEPNVDNSTKYETQQFEQMMKRNPTNYHKNKRLEQSRIDKQKRKLKLVSFKKEK